MALGSSKFIDPGINIIIDDGRRTVDLGGSRKCSIARIFLMCIECIANTPLLLAGHHNSTCAGACKGFSYRCRHRCTIFFFDDACFVHRWEAKDGKPGVGDLYLSAMDALDAISSAAIYFIEGTGQQSFVTGWGDGFVTDASLIAQHNLSDPRPFLNALLGKAYVTRVGCLCCTHRSGSEPSVACSAKGADVLTPLGALRWPCSCISEHLKHATDL